MYYKKEFTSPWTALSLTSKTKVKFNSNCEFIVAPFKDSEGNNCFRVQDIKGDLEIVKITVSDLILMQLQLMNQQQNDYVLDYDSDAKQFNFCSENNYCFTVAAKIDVKVVFASAYHLQIPSARFRDLKLYECFESKIVLPEYKNFVFPLYVKKINPTPKTACNDVIELHIVNPYNARIQGKTGDYILRHSLKDVNFQLSFVIERSDSDATPIDEPATEIANDDLNGVSVVQKEAAIAPTHQRTKDRARSSTTMKNDEQESQPPSKKKRVNSTKLYEILSNQKYSDVILISSDNVEISSYRNVLSKYSSIFAKVIDVATELPVKINVENFDAKTIQAALHFLYEKIDAIDGKETAVFKFGLHYDIQKIMVACCSFFEESVAPKNVCELIQIAYSNNFEELKKKCLKTLREKKKEIDASKWNDLPKEIIIEAFCL
uniref:BTB domain-containing protein n=1 Tax=Panagrolaimus sp. ES5 TaxID=591445 RepID=A0AC34FSY0_9BILA